MKKILTFLLILFLSAQPAKAFLIPQWIVGAFLGVSLFCFNRSVSVCRNDCTEKIRRQKKEFDELVEKNKELSMQMNFDNYQRIKKLKRDCREAFNVVASKFAAIETR
jgi:hypothetical protein